MPRPAGVSHSSLPAARRRGGPGAWLAAALLLGAASSGLTQYAAWHFGYQPALGPQTVGYLYPPWAWFGWYWRYNRANPTFWGLIGGGFVLALLASLLVIALGRGRRRAPQPQEGLHGTAHWADAAEIRASGLLPDPGQPGTGVYVGGWTDEGGRLHYLRHNGPEHVIAVAPTRSAKTVGLTVPTLLSWPHSCVVNDQKMELWNMTAGWRATHAGNRCILFSPGAIEGSASYNPLHEIRIGTLHEVGDAQNLATMLVDPDGKGLSSHWDKTAHAFLIGVILHKLHEGRLRVATFVKQAIAREMAKVMAEAEARYYGVAHGGLLTSRVKLQFAKAHNLDAKALRAASENAMLEALRPAWTAAIAAGAAWDVLNADEQAAVRHYAKLPETSFVNEFRAWTDAGSRWTRLMPAARDEISLYLRQDAEARRAQLRNMDSARQPVALADIRLALSDPRRPIDELYSEMIENTHDVAGLMHETGTYFLKHPGQHTQIASAAAAMLTKPEEERGSVLSTAHAFLGIYDDPIVTKNLRRSDFSISDLMDSAQPVTLYLAAREEDKDRLRPLMRLVVNQIVRVLLRPKLAYVDGQQVSPHLHRLLLMLDEFPSYGKLEVFEDALSYIAGYGIKAYLIAQDVSQLWKAYGKEESIISNCHIRIAYAPNKLETAKWLSDMVGKTTVQTEEFSESGKKFAPLLERVSRNLRQTERELMTADEAMRLKAATKDKQGRITAAGEMLIFVAGHAPIKGTQTLYFLDPVFAQRVRHNAPASADTAAPPRVAAPPASLPPLVEAGRFRLSRREAVS